MNQLAIGAPRFYENRQLVRDHQLMPIADPRRVSLTH
jgi:hypothetical protein